MASKNQRVNNININCGVFNASITNNNCTFNLFDLGKFQDTEEEQEEEAAEKNCDEVVAEPVEDEPTIGLCNLHKINLQESLLMPYIADSQNAKRIIAWLHYKISIGSDIRQKLLPLRAACEHGYFTTLIKHKDFCLEFDSDISKQAYSKWMGEKCKYSDNEIKSVLADLEN